MSANLIKCDKSKDLTRLAIRGMQLIREGMYVLEQARAAYLQSRETGADGSQSSHYALTATEGGYSAGGYADANSAAKASFDEIDSLYSKVGTDNAVSNVRAAILQACAKHGV